MRHGSGSARRPSNEQLFWFTDVQLMRLEQFFPERSNQPLLDDRLV